MAMGRLAWMARQIGASTSIRGAAQSCGGFAVQQRLRLDLHSIAEPKSKRRQDTLSRVLEDRGERLADKVDFVAAVELDVLQRDFPVLRQVACRPCRSHPKTLNQVWATDLTEEVEPEIDEGQPLTLGVAQAIDALGLSHRRLLIKEGRPKDRYRFYVCSFLDCSCNQYNYIMRRYVNLHNTATPLRWVIKLRASQHPNRCTPSAASSLGR